jgi:quinol monooxygenase YgiN
MLKSTAMISATIALSVTAGFLLALRSGEVLAQSAPLYINAVDIDVVPGQIDNYLAALKENGAAAVKQEPGCHEFNITVSQKDRTTSLSSRCMTMLLRWTRIDRLTTSKNTPL